MSKAITKRITVTALISSGLFLLFILIAHDALWDEGWDAGFLWLFFCFIGLIFGLVSLIILFALLRNEALKDSVFSTIFVTHTLVWETGFFILGIMRGLEAPLPIIFVFGALFCCLVLFKIRNADIKSNRQKFFDNDEE